MLVISGVSFFSRGWGVHTLIAGALLAIVGTQVARAGTLRARLRHLLHGREGPLVRPHARDASGSSTVCSWAASLHWSASCACGVIAIDWINSGFGALGEEKLAVIGATLIIIGIQIFFSSFLLSILGLRRR